MAKFEFEFELQGLQGLKLKVKTERPDELPQHFATIGRHIAAAMQSPSQILNGEPDRKQIEATVTDPPADDAEKGKGGKGKGGKRRANGREPTTPLTWSHDPSKWGMPKQSWKVGDKFLWVAYVILKELQKSEVPAGVLAETFNTHFKQFGPVTRKNTPRDLGYLKTRTPAQMMDNATHTPVTWYLTEEGIKEAEKLIIEAKSGGAA